MLASSSNNSSGTRLADLPDECFRDLGLRDWLALAQTCVALRRFADARLASPAAEPLDADLSLVAARRAPHALAFLAGRVPQQLRSLRCDGARLHHPDGALLAPLLGAKLARLVLRGCDLGGAAGAGGSGRRRQRQQPQQQQQQGGQQQEGQEPLAELGRRCRALVHLDLAGSGPVTTRLLASFGGLQQEGCCAPAEHPLQVLLLAGCTFDDACAALAALPPLGRLARLDIGAAPGSGAPAMPTGAIARGLLAASKGARPFPALQSLGLRRQQLLGHDDLAAAARALLPGLVSLDLGGALQSRAQLIDALEADGGAVAAGVSTLEALDLRWASVRCRGLADADVAALAAALPSLSRLDISGHAAIGDNGLLSLAACSRLWQLTLARQPHVTAAGLERLLELLPHLDTVTAVRCRHLHARALAALSSRFASSRGLRLLMERDDEEAGGGVCNHG